MNKIFSIALSQIGIREIVGSKHNPEVLKYFSEIGHEWVKDDETAWCSAFWNWVVSKAGKKGSGKLNARSWLDTGVAVSLEDAQIGDTVVLWRKSPKDWRGHVGGYVRHDKNFIYLLGGNQSNSVSIRAYPRHRLLSIRRL